MRWMPVIMGIGIITAGCGSESTGSGGSGSGDSTATTGASSSSGGQGGSGGSGGSSATSSTSGTTSSSTTGSTSSATSSSSTGTGMGAVFGATCAVDGDCASGLCANFMQKGMHCSLKCTTAAQCPPESPGCGGQGVCKPPA